MGGGVRVGLGTRGTGKRGRRRWEEGLGEETRTAGTYAGRWGEGMTVTYTVGGRREQRMGTDSSPGQLGL